MGTARRFAGILGVWLLRNPGGRITSIKAVRVGEAEEILRVVFTTSNSKTRTITKEVLFEIIERKNNGTRRLGNMSLATVSKDEMERLLNRSGFSVVRMMGGFHGEPFRGDSEFQVYLCGIKHAR